MACSLNDEGQITAVPAATNWPTATPTSTAEPSSTATPSQTPSATPAPTQSPTVTPTPTPIITDIEVIFTTQKEDNNYFSGNELWRYDTLTESKELLYSTDAGISIMPWTTWHPENKNFLYFVLSEDESLAWSLWRVDIEDKTTEPVTTWLNETYRGIPVDWSAEGKWLRLYTGSFESGYVDYAIVNIDTGEYFIEPLLDDLNWAWAPDDPDTFAFVSDDKDEDNILIASASTRELLQRIPRPCTTEKYVLSDSFWLARFVWQPNTNSLITFANSESINDQLLIIKNDWSNSQDCQWLELQPYTIPSPISMSWSPSSNYLAVNTEGAFKWVFQSNDLSLPPELIYSGGLPVGWLTDPERLIVSEFRSSDDHIVILAIDPGLPTIRRQNQQLLLDLTAIEEKAEYVFLNVRELD